MRKEDRRLQEINDLREALVRIEIAMQALGPVYGRLRLAGATDAMIENWSRMHASLEQATWDIRELGEAIGKGQRHG